MSAEMTALIPKFKRLLTRYADSYGLPDHVEQLCEDGLGKGTTPAFLWWAFREGHFDLGATEPLWQKALAHDDTSVYDADDLVRWIQGVNAAFPNGVKPDGSELFFSDAIPGELFQMTYAFEYRREDDAFNATMKRRWADLPDPWRIAVGWHLARHSQSKADRLQLSDLPRPLALSAARVVVQQAASLDEHLPADELGPLLVEAGLSPEVVSLKAPQIVGELAPYTDVASTLALLSKCEENWYAWPGIEKLDVLPDEALPQIQQAFAALPIAARGYNEPAPAFLHAFLWLRHCKRQGVTPDAALDDQLVALFTHYELTWSGGGEAEHRAKIRDHLSIVPEPRLSAALLAPPELPWTYITASTAPATLEAITDQLRTLPGRPDYHVQQLIERLMGTEYEKHTNSLLRPITGALVDHFVEALSDDGTSTQGQLVMAHLLSLMRADEQLDAAAIPGLAAALNSKSKPVRELAEQALSQGAPAAALPHVIPQLSAKRKDTRLAAAYVLAALPATAEGHAAAVERLKKEKAAAVSALLERVLPPAEAPEGDSAELLAALEESEGARWREFEHLGAELVAVYVQYLAQQHRDDTLSFYGDQHEHWLEIFAALQGDPEIRQQALALTPCYGYYYDDYLTALDEAAEGLEAEIIPWALTSDLKRPPIFGQGRLKLGLDNLVGWAAERDAPRFMPLLIGALKDTRRKVLDKAIPALKAHPELALPLLHEVILKGDAAALHAAQILGSLADPSSLAPLQKAHAAHPTAKAITEALALVQAASVDLDALDDDQLDAALAALQAPAIPKALDLAALPPIKWRSGQTVSEAATAWLVGTVAMETVDRASGPLQQAARRLDLTCTEPFIQGLLAQWDTPLSGWPLFARAIFGGPDQVAAIAAKLDELASSQRTHWGSEGVEALVRNGSDAAIRSLDAAHRKTRRDALRWRSAAGLSKLAQARGVTVEDLVDAAMSPCGFDLNGQQIVDYGSRRFILQLDEDLNIGIVNEETGKTVKSLPAARAADDADKVRQGKAHLSAVRKEMKQIQKVQPRRLESALASDRRWPLADWRKRFVDHPLMRPMAQRLVWEILDASGAVVAQIRVAPPTAEGEVALDLAGAPVALPEGGAVRLLHPIHLTAEQREAWREALWAAHVRPLFTQLEREVYRPEDVPEDLFTQLPRLTAGALMRGLTPLGYERGPREDAGCINVSYRSLGEYDVTLSHDGYIPDWPEAEIEVQGVTVRTGGEPVEWRALPPLIFSEIARDLYTLTQA